MSDQKAREYLESHKLHPKQPLVLWEDAHAALNIQAQAYLAHIGSLEKLLKYCFEQWGYAAEDGVGLMSHGAASKLGHIRNEAKRLGVEL